MSATSQPARLVVLISGTGRNLQAMLDAIEAGRLPARAVAVISNKPAAQGLERAAKAGVPTEVIDHRRFESREAFDRTLAERIEHYRPDLVALAGFMRILTPQLVKRFEGRMFNIHPSLLPKYRGLHTHQRALEAGDRRHGASVHYVTDELDGGPVVLQGSIDIHPQDTADSLAARVMKEVELRIYPQVLTWAAQGRIALTGEGVAFDGRLLDAPLHMETLTANNGKTSA